MRLVFLLAPVACAPAPDVPERAGPCVEARDRLEPRDRTVWGTGVRALQVATGGTSAGALDDGSRVELSLSWPGGPDWMVWAESTQAPDPRPPLWCVDRVESPARVTLTGPGGSWVFTGLWRATGPYADLEHAFVGRAPSGDSWPWPMGEGDEVALWVSWVGGSTRGDLRRVPLGSDETFAGDLVDRVVGD